MEHESVLEPNSWFDMGNVPLDVVMGFMEGEEQLNLPEQKVHKGRSLEEANPQHSGDCSELPMG